jgi:hypothetical protein
VDDEGFRWTDEIDPQPADQPQRWNRIGEQFSARPVEMQRSAAWRVLNNAERMMLDRIEIELASHGGKDNGSLPVTFADFEKYGVRRKSVASSRRALVALGFITHEAGRYSSPTRQDPSKFGLTYKPIAGDRRPLHRWRRQPDDIKACDHIAMEARNSED